MKPPFPAVSGSVLVTDRVNNVETLTCRTGHHQNGRARLIRNWGRKRAAGPKLWSVSGHVNRPGVYELPMGYHDMEKFILEDCQGIHERQAIKGSDFPVALPSISCGADQIIGKDVRMDYEGLVTAGSMVGSGGFNRDG
jgi:NADH-quinone oxidoreductase subunit F